MNGSGHLKPSLKELGQVTRKPLVVSQGETVRMDYLETGQPIPIAVRPVVERIDPTAWALENRGLIEKLLLSHGAVLFRGFAIATVSDFKNFVRASSSGELLEYTDRSSPRHAVGDGIYISTIYPAHQRIDLHNEGTYWLAWPRKIYFCCLSAPLLGGETPIANVRKVFERLDPRIRDRFIEKQVMYVRNYNDGFGLPWQEAFQTRDRAEAEIFGRKNSIQFEWKEGNRVRTRQVRPAVRRHPVTGDWLWFNHAAFFHITAREPNVRKGLLEMFDEQDLPYMTYYGDGTAIDPMVVEHITQAYQEEKTDFPWQVSDILLLDNMLVAHGREAYKGNRQVVVAMAEPYQEER